VIVAPAPDAVAVTFGPTKLTELTLSVVPTTEPSSRIVIPVIAPAEAAFTQSTPPEPVDARTCPAAPDSLSLSKREPRSLMPPFTSKFVVGVVVPIPTL
jgi:hypothetical protein